jgi:hypothetical protein
MQNRERKIEGGREKENEKYREKTKIVLNTQKTHTHHTYTDATQKVIVLPGYDPTRLTHTLDNRIAGARPRHAKAVDARVQEQIII